MLQGTGDPYISCEHSERKACVLATSVHNGSAFVRKLQGQSQVENVTPPCPHFLKPHLDWQDCSLEWNKRTPLWSKYIGSEGWWSGAGVPSKQPLPAWWELLPSGREEERSGQKVSRTALGEPELPVLLKHLCTLEFLRKATPFSPITSTGEWPVQPLWRMCFSGTYKAGLPQEMQKCAQGCVLGDLSHPQGTRRPGADEQQVQVSLLPASIWPWAVLSLHTLALLLTFWSSGAAGWQGLKLSSHLKHFSLVLFISLQVRTPFLLEILRRPEPNHKTQLVCSVTTMWASWIHYAYGFTGYI